MKRCLMMAVAAICGLTPFTAQSQSSTPARVGVLGGVNLAKLGGDDVDGSGTRTGLLAGVSFIKPLSGAVSLELNGLFSQKGAEDSEDGTSFALKLNYIEVPVLLRYDAKTSTGIRPHVSGGISLGLQTSCKISAREGGISGEASCSELEFGTGLETKKFDAGLLVGGGLDFPLAAGKAFTLGARYSFGLTDVIEDASVRNRGFQIFAGLSIPLR